MRKNSFICILVLVLTVMVGCSKSTVQINGVADLDGKKIGVKGGTSGETWAQKNVKDATILSFKSGLDAAIDLKNGAVDAIILDEFLGKEVVSREPSLRLIKDEVFTKNRESYAIAVKKGNTEMINIINSTIKTMKENGEYDKLVDAFLPADGIIKIPEDVILDSDKILRFGTNAEFPPFEYVEGKKIVGFDITMGQKIAIACNRKCELVDMAFDSLIPALQSGTVDYVVAGMSVTEERKKNVDFSDPYFESEQVIVVRK